MHTPNHNDCGDEQTNTIDAPRDPSEGVVVTAYAPAHHDVTDRWGDHL